MRSDKFWIILISAVLLLCVGAVLLLRYGAAGSDSVARIYSNGNLIDTIDLSMLTARQEITITAPPAAAGGYNVIEAMPGSIRIIETNCPGGDCARMGLTPQGFTPIVCLPHRLVITAEGSADIDAVTG